MSHTDRCIRSDGDWLCAPGCHHDKEEREAEERVVADRALAAKVLRWATSQGEDDGVMSCFILDDKQRAFFQRLANRVESGEIKVS